MVGEQSRSGQDRYNPENRFTSRPFESYKSSHAARLLELGMAPEELYASFQRSGSRFVVRLCASLDIGKRKTVSAEISPFLQDGNHFNFDQGVFG